MRLTFDPDLTGELMPSLSRMVLERQVKGLPPQLVRDFRVDWLLDGAVVAVESVTGNAMRLRVLEKPDPLRCNAVRVTVTATHGAPCARIFEIRLMEPGRRARQRAGHARKAGRPHRLHRQAGG